MAQLECHLFYISFSIMSILNTWVFGSALGQVCVFAQLPSPSLSIVTADQFCLEGWFLLLLGGTVNYVVHLPLSWVGHKTWPGQSAALSFQYKSWDGWQETAKEWQLDRILTAPASWVSQAAVMPVQCKRWFFSSFFESLNPPVAETVRSPMIPFSPYNFQSPAVRADHVTSSYRWQWSRNDMCHFQAEAVKKPLWKSPVSRDPCVVTKEATRFRWCGYKIVEPPFIWVPSRWKAELLLTHKDYSMT